MEHLFDSLSKDLARVSRRQAIGTFVRGAVGAFLASTWLGSRSAQAQSAACTTCGTCQIYDASTGALTNCANACEAQVVCNAVQSYAPYTDLAAALSGTNGLQATSYSVLLFETSSYKTAVFQTTYASSQFPSNTANLFVAWGPEKGEVRAFAVNYQNGVPTYAYGVGASGIEQIALPTPPPLPTAAPAQAESLAVTTETCSWITTNVCNTFQLTTNCAVLATAVGLLALGGLTIPLALASGFLTIACIWVSLYGAQTCTSAVNQMCACSAGTIPCTLPDGSASCCDCPVYCPSGGTCQTSAASIEAGIVNQASSVEVCVMGTCPVGSYIPCPGGDNGATPCCYSDYDCCGPIPGVAGVCCCPSVAAGYTGCADYPRCCY
jgi:hypothetical protein